MLSGGRGALWRHPAPREPGTPLRPGPPSAAHPTCPPWPQHQRLLEGRTILGHSTAGPESSAVTSEQAPGAVAGGPVVSSMLDFETRL